MSKVLKQVACLENSWAQRSLLGPDWLGQKVDMYSSKENFCRAVTNVEMGGPV